MNTQLHASCVDLDGRGVLITGAAGRGKSTLALALITQGARLVADDQVVVRRPAEEGASQPMTPPLATRPETLPTQIEARGVGLLNAPMAKESPVHLVIDMDQDEAERLPPLRHFTLLGCRIPLLYRGDPISFGNAVGLMLRHGRSIP